MFDILYTVILTFLIMMILHHLYNYLQTNLTVPKVNEIIHPTILHDLQEVQNPDTIKTDELKEYLNQFKKKE
jgi:hypothetical protein